MELFCMGLSAGVALSAVFAIIRGYIRRRARNKKAAKDADACYAADEEIEAIMNYNGEETK